MSSIRDTPAVGDRRPLTARSVIASTLLGVDPPRLPALALVRSGELFGLREGATRTALSRMAAAGEVEADDGHYALRGSLLERHARQQAARQVSPRPWDGSWVAAVVTEERRSAERRAQFRDAARRLAMAELREGMWIRPDDLDPDRHPDARAVVDTQATWLRDIRPDDSTALVGAFGPERWATTARALIDEMAQWQPDLDDRRVEALAPTFELDAAVLRHLVADPVLPAELLPADWPGTELRAALRRFDESFKATWRGWYRSFRQGSPNR